MHKALISIPFRILQDVATLRDAGTAATYCCAFTRQYSRLLRFSFSTRAHAACKIQGKCTSLKTANHQRTQKYSIPTTTLTKNTKRQWSLACFVRQYFIGLQISESESGNKNIVIKTSPRFNFDPVYWLTEMQGPSTLSSTFNKTS